MHCSSHWSCCSRSPRPQWPKKPRAATTRFTARRGIQQAELSGEFYQIQDLDIDIWVPDLLQPVEEVSENTFCAFEAENKGAVISVNHLTFDGQPTLEEVEKMAVDQGSVSDGMFWINGFDTLVLETKSEDSLSVIIMITDGGAMEFAFAPISNPDVYSMASLVMSTIQHHTLDVEDVALMIDADLNSFWTQDKNVTYSDDDKDRSIHIAMWEDGVNAETIKDINNWDEVKNARIGLYNDYMDALRRGHLRRLCKRRLILPPRQKEFSPPAAGRTLSVSQCSFVQASEVGLVEHR